MISQQCPTHSGLGLFSCSAQCRAPTPVCVQRITRQGSLALLLRSHQFAAAPGRNGTAQCRSEQPCVLGKLVSVSESEITYTLRSGILRPPRRRCPWARETATLACRGPRTGCIAVGEESPPAELPSPTVLSSGLTEGSRLEGLTKSRITVVHQSCGLTKNAAH